MPEEYRNLVNLVLRDHQGFTGDGHGGVGDLPVGDRSTARKPVEKRDLREVMLAADASVDAAIEAAERAENAATDAHGASLIAEDLPALLADTALTYPTGTVFMTRRGGTSYQVSDPSATDYHYITAGGVKLYEAGPSFSSRERLGEAVSRSALDDGAVVFVAGQPYIIDSTATGMNSAMWDMGVDGVRAPDRPLNAYVAAFHDHNSPRVIRLYSSTDGLAWRLLNSLPLEYDGGGVINGGNPVLCYRDRWFWLLVSFTSVGNYDFRIYKTRDFSNWLGPFNCNAGPTPIGSHTNPAPGGSVPANEVWGADMSFTPDGELYVFVAVPYAPDTVDIRGRPIGDRRIYQVRCNDLDALTFDAPVIVLPDGDDWSMIDASVTRTPGDWLLNVKDESRHTIRVYTGPSITGPWEFQEEVENTTYAIEGSSIVPRRLANGDVAWDLYCEGHNTIDDWVAAQRMMVYRGGTTPTGWGSVAPTYLRSTRGIRHGTPLNLGFEDPAAFAAFERFAATAAGDGIETNEQWVELLPGDRTRVPQNGQVFYITGSTVTNLTILDGPADEFYVAVLSANVAAGIVVQAAGMSSAEVAIGFGQSNDRLVRFRKRDSTGRYYAEAGAARSAFSATKGGTNQTVPATTITKVTFPSEDLDVGGHYASSKWTPPAGQYLIRASIVFSGASVGSNNYMRLRKNGIAFRQSIATSQTGDNTLSVAAMVSANGTDTFDITVSLGGTGDKTISGAADETWFEGVPV